jgi:hypothetical protein
MLSHRSRTLVPAVLGLTLALALCRQARADFVVNVTESGGDVLATGSGTIDTTDLTFLGYGGAGAFLNASTPAAFFGPNTPVTVNYYSGISGPGSFGASNQNFEADSGNGDLVGVYPTTLWLPQNYVSGSLLSSSDTFAGQSFSSLGLTPGTYTWTWGSGADADSFTMNIGPSAAVPEPASFMMLGTGSLALLDYARRRRRVGV